MMGYQAFRGNWLHGTKLQGIAAVLLAATAIFFVQTTAAGARNSVPHWNAQLYEHILHHVSAPTFPHRIFDVRRYGAKGDGKTDCQRAFHRAIMACHAAGGGEVLVPAGNYVCDGPITLLSNVNFHTQYGATITFGFNPKDYLTGSPKHKGCVLVRYEGVWCYNYSPLIYALRQTNVAVTGEGIFNGQRNAPGSTWIHWYNSQQRLHWHDRMINWGYSDHLTPMRKRIFGRGYHLMPEFCDFEFCHNVLIEGVTFINSPFWTMHPSFCRNVTVEGVTVYNHDKFMDDGLDIDSCNDVLVQDCNIRNDDDNIVIKSGRNADAWSINGGRPSQNIIIRDNWLSHNIGFGSEMSGGIRNVMALDNEFGPDADIIYMKWGGERGGYIRDIYFRGIYANSARCLTDPSIYHWAGGYQLPDSGFVPRVSDWSISHVHINYIDDQHDPVIALANFNPCPFADVRLSDIHIGHIPPGTPALWLKNTASIEVQHVFFGGVKITLLHLRVHRTGGGMTLHWHSSPAAAKYAVSIHGINTIIIPHPQAHRLKLRIHGADRIGRYVTLTAMTAGGEITAVDAVKIPPAHAPRVSRLTQLIARAKKMLDAQSHAPAKVPMHYTARQRMISHLFYCIHVADLIAHNPTATSAQILTAEQMLQSAMR